MQMMKLLLLVLSFSLVTLAYIDSILAESVPELDNGTINSSIGTVESLRSQFSHRSIDLLSSSNQGNSQQNQGVITQTEDNSDCLDETE